MKIKTLHEQALSFAKIYLSAESDLIAVLQEIDLCRGFRELGYKSLFEYGTEGLGLSEAIAYNLITVARKSREVPMLKDKVREGAITLSSARKVASVITKQTQDRWLDAASSLSTRELEKEIAKENPKLAVTERAQEIVSTKTKKSASLEETIEMLAKLFLEKEDPLEKAQRSRPPRKPHDPSNREVPALIKHQVKLRDGDQCTHLKNKVRCNERKWLDIHHIHPVSEGGLTVLENLTTLCRGHHQLIHSYQEELAG